MISELQHLSLSIWLRKGNDTGDKALSWAGVARARSHIPEAHGDIFSTPYQWGLTSSYTWWFLPHGRHPSRAITQCCRPQSWQLTRALLLNCSQTTCISRAWPLQHLSWSHLWWLPKQRLLRTQSAKQTISSPVSIRLQERETGSQSYYVHESICLLQQKCRSLVWPKVLW